MLCTTIKAMIQVRASEGGQIRCVSFLLLFFLWRFPVEQRNTGKPSNHMKDQNDNPIAHQKGDLIFDGSTGVWLLHSVPGFPLSHKIRWDNYPDPNWVYIRQQAFFGQTFYCMSVSAPTIDMLAGMFQYSYPWIYDSHVPANLKSQFPQVQQLLAGTFFKSYSNNTFSTLGGLQHVVFQKNGATDSDLYEDYVAPYLKTGLKTETWCGGLDGFQCMPSFCKGEAISNPSGPQKSHKKYEYDSINSQELNFAPNEWFTNKYDHAKFAMAYNRGSAPTAKWFCPADINRMASQRARGGGAACAINPVLWDALDKIITKYDDKCQS